MSYLITFFLIVFSALFSGLTLGLMGLDSHVLKRKMQLGNEQAKKIFPLRKRGNLLLTTLLLGNVAVNAALSIFLGSIATGFIAGLIATALIFLFGEIIPQAVISRHAMSFGAKTANLVWVLIVIMYPITAPIAWILDKALGDEMPSVYSRGELMSVIKEHESSSQSDLDAEEARVIEGALTFSDKLVRDVMTPRTVAVMLDKTYRLTPKNIKKLKESGHSRFPVYEKSPDKIVGMLYIQKLVGENLKNKTVANFFDKSVYFVNITSQLDDVLNTFFKTRHHLFIAVDEFGATRGLISIEDIIEEIVGTEIMDEFDRYADLREIAKRRAKKSNKSV